MAITADKRKAVQTRWMEIHACHNKLCVVAISQAAAATSVGGGRNLGLARPLADAYCQNTKRTIETATLMANSGQRCGAPRKVNISRNMDQFPAEELRAAATGRNGSTALQRVLPSKSLSMTVLLIC